MKKPRGPLFWIPRILAILLIAFLALFSLDSFQPGLSAGEIALALLMHNIPVLVLIALLAVAWKWDLVGAVTFVGAGLLYIGLNIFNVFGTGLPWYLAISWSLSLAGPAIFVGALFYLNWAQHRRAPKTRETPVAPQL